MATKKICVIASHPIQYQAPIFRALNESSKYNWQVVFLTRHGIAPTFDPLFQQEIFWDIDLLGGYNNRFQHGAPVKRGSYWSERLRFREFCRLLRLSDVSGFVVFGWSNLATLQVCTLAFLKRCSLTLIAETFVVRKPGIPVFKHLLRFLFLRTLFQFVDRFVSIGPSNVRFYMSMGVDVGRIIERVYCSDIDFFARFIRDEDVLEARTEARASLGIPGAALSVLFVGKFEPKKRPLAVVLAVLDFARHNRSSEVVLTLVGNGELKDELKNICDQHRSELSNLTITLPGFVNQTDLPTYYLASDLLILPSDHRETWGLVLNEAMFFGCEIIFSAEIGSASFFRNFSNGVVYDVGPSTISTKIEGYARNPRSPNDIHRIAVQWGPRQFASGIEESFDA